MVYPLLSYAQIRVSVPLSLGYRFTICRSWELGRSFGSGSFWSPHTQPCSFICCWGFVPWFSLSWVGRTWTNLSPGLHIDLLLVACCGAQSMPELGHSLVLWSLWYMLPSPMIWFSFVEYWVRVCISPPSCVGYRFLVWDASLARCMQLIDLISSRSLSLSRLEVHLWITNSWLGFC